MAELALQRADARSPERAALRRPSYRLGALFGALLCLGLVMIASAAATSGPNAANFLPVLARRLAFTALGVLAFAAGATINYQWWRRHCVLLSALALGLLVLVLMPGVGTTVNGARRWLRLGGLMGVQPSEFAKVILLIAVAAYCERNLSAKGPGKCPTQMGTLVRGFIVPCAGIGAVSALVLIEPDFGSAVLIGALGVGVLLVCGTKPLYVLAAGVAVLPLAKKLVFEVPYRLERITTFLDPWRDPTGAGYQLVQSLVAIGSGGATGKGLGAGAMGFLPAASNDFIFSTIAEQLGFVGAAVVIGLFVWITCEGLGVALRARDAFGCALAFGITLLFGLQAVINIAVATGCLPTKGLSLPFVSAGGSSLCISLWAAGILVNIARSEELPERFQLVPWQRDVPGYEHALWKLAGLAGSTPKRGTR